MIIAVLVFLALLASAECKPLTLTRSASSEDYFLPIINNLSSKKDFAGLCALRKEILLKELQENENLNERKQLIEYLDQIGNDKAGFDPVSCLQLDSDFIFMDNMDKTQSDQEVSFKDEEMSKNRLAKLDEFMPDDLNQEDKNKTLQAALKSVQTLTLNATDFNLEQEDFNLGQADFNLEHAEIEDYLKCDSDCESLKSETEMSSTFESTEQENAEKLKLTITIVGSVCLIVIVLILFAFAIKECCFPSFSFC